MAEFHLRGQSIFQRPCRNNRLAYLPFRYDLLLGIDGIDGGRLEGRKVKRSSQGDGYFLFPGVYISCAPFARIEILSQPKIELATNGDISPDKSLQTCFRLNSVMVA